MITVPRTDKNICRHELIGLEVEIPNKNIHGTIVDETQKTLTIRTGEKKIMTIKNENTYKLKLEDGNAVELNGTNLYGRPEERIKKKTKSKWTQ